MKRYNNLFPKIYDLGNIELAHQNARKGKRHYREVKMVDADPDKYFGIIYDMLKNKTLKYGDKLPFLATIRKINKYYSLT